MSHARRSRSTRRWNDSFTPAIERLEERALLAGTWSEANSVWSVSSEPSFPGVPQIAPAVAVGSDGHYVVAWGHDSGAINFRRFDAYEQPLDTANRTSGIGQAGVTSYPNLRDPSNGMAANGDFVIAVEVDRTINGLPAGTQVGFLRFAADGTKRGESFVGNTATSNHSPSIAVADDGRFVIGWTEVDSGGASAAYFQTFEAIGDAISTPIEFTEAETTEDVAINPGNGDFVVVGKHEYDDGSGGTASDLYHAVYRIDGSVKESASRISNTSVGSQFKAAAAMTRNSETLIAWSDGESIRVRGTAEIVFNSSRYIASKSTSGSTLLDVDVAVSPSGEAFVVGFVEDTGSARNVLYRTHYKNHDGDDQTEIISSGADTVSVAMNVRNDFVLTTDVDVRVSATYRRFQSLEAIGVFRDGMWYLDKNYDGESNDDWIDWNFRYGLAGDQPVVGDWNGDGLDEVGVFRDGVFYLDVNGNRLFDPEDLIYHFGLIGDQAIAVDWDGDGKDQIAVFRDGLWCIDIDGDGVWGAVDTSFVFGTRGDVPLIMDPDNAGRPSVAVYRNGIWSVDLDRNGFWYAGADLAFGFGLAGDQAVSGNWYRDDSTGDDNATVFRNGVWSFDYDEDDAFGSEDGSTIYGMTGDVPVVGRWSSPSWDWPVAYCSCTVTIIRQPPPGDSIGVLVIEEDDVTAVSLNDEGESPAVDLDQATTAEATTFLPDGRQGLLRGDEQSWTTVEDDGSVEEVIALLEREEDFEASAVEEAFAFELVEELLAI